MKVSVVVPIYNTAKYLTECIDSLINQTYTDLEIILVDDGSFDDSPAICDEYAKKDQRVKVIHKENGGLSSARKAGINASTGEYLMILDSDDWLDTDAIGYCVNHQDFNDGVDVVCFSYIREYENASLPVHIFSEDAVLTGNSAKNFYRRLFGPIGTECQAPQRIDNLVSCCMKLYRGDIVKKGRFFHSNEVGSCEDGLFNMYALYGCDKILCVDKCFYHYRKEGGTITSGYRPNLINQWNRLFDIMYAIAEEKSLGEECKTALKNRIAFSTIGIGLNEFSNVNKSFSRHKKVISAYLKSERYKNSVKDFSIKKLPLKWKLFMFCCKHRLAFSVSLMLKIMMKLKSKV